MELILILVIGFEVLNLSILMMSKLNMIFRFDDTVAFNLPAHEESAADGWSS